MKYILIFLLLSLNAFSQESTSVSRGPGGKDDYTFLKTDANGALVVSGSGGGGGGVFDGQLTQGGNPVSSTNTLPVTIFGTVPTHGVTQSGTWVIDSITNPVAVTFPSIPLATNAATLTEQQFHSTKLTNIDSSTASVDGKLSTTNTTLSAIDTSTAGANTKLTTTNTKLTSIETSVQSIDGKITTTANGVKVDAFLSSIPLATNAATLSEQQSQTTKLTSIDSKLTGPLAVTSTDFDVRDLLFATDKVDVTGSSIVVSSLPLPPGAATDRTTAAAPYANRLSNGTSFYDSRFVGEYLSTPPALTTGDVSKLQLDISGNLKIADTAAMSNTSQILSDVYKARAVPSGPGNGAAPGNTLVGGVYYTNPLTLSDGDQSELNLDNKGNLKVSVENTVPTLNIGGVDINNWPSLQLTSGSLPGVTGNEGDTTSNFDANDFLVVGGHDVGNNQYRALKFSGDSLNVLDSNSFGQLNAINTKTRDALYIPRTVATPPINLDFFTGSIGTTVWYDAQNYRFGSLSIIGTIATGSVILEGTNDNTSAVGTPIPIKVGNSVVVAPLVAAFAVPVASTNYIFAIKFRYIRLRQAVASTGTVTAKFLLTPQIQENDDVYVTGGAITVSTVATVSTISNVAAITPSVSAGGYPTYHTLISAASTNATLVKNTAAMIGSISVSNTLGTPFYFKLFNLAAAPVVGTTVPTYTYFIPASTTLNIPVPAYGTRFNLGVSYSTTVNAPTADTTAITAGQAIININYL